jgi:hypothetical protein
MINKIFWDIDETLIHTTNRALGSANAVAFKLKNNKYTYNTIIRSCSKELIDYTREVVGFDNVYILTAATSDYANKVNELAGWAFHPDHIIAREDVSQHYISTAYGGDTVSPNKLAHKYNVLIDNLPYRENYDKINLIGISEDRYMKIHDYYGVEYEGRNFEEEVKAFIMNAHKEEEES